MRRAYSANCCNPPTRSNGAADRIGPQPLKRRLSTYTFAQSRIREEAEEVMKLIGSLTSPFVRKARIVLAEKKIDYKLVLENPWADETTIHTFNPIGKVPCLVMEDGEAVFDSRVICEYVDTLSPVGKLIPQPGRERIEVRCWEALADGMMDAAVLVRIEDVQREAGERSEKWLT